MIKSNRSIQKGNQQDKGFGNGVTLFHVRLVACVLVAHIFFRVESREVKGRIDT